MSHHCGPKVHLICGFLGVGKTTALRALSAKRPPDERWAILVNEVGMVDVDGALLDASTPTMGVRVETLPGGCICCTTQAPFREAVAECLRTVQPHRLFIEPTGLAAPGPLLASLREAPFTGALEVGAVVTMVDPRRFLSPAMREHPVFREQLDLADVLVANRCDLATEAQLAAFVEQAEAWVPSKQVVATCVQGALDLAWFDLPPRETPLRADRRVVHAPAETSASHRPDAPLPDADGVVRWAHADGLASTCGWVFPPEERFVPAILESVLGILANPGPLLSDGALRVKGLVRLEHGAAAVNADADAVCFEAVDQVADSRLEIIVAPGTEPAWGTIEAALVSATCPRIR